MSKTTKYTKEFKLICVLKYLNGEYVETPANTKKHTFTNNVDEWVRLYNIHGEKGLENIKHNFTIEQKIQMVLDILSGDSLTNVAIKNGFTSTHNLKNGVIYIRNMV